MTDQELLAAMRSVLSYDPLTGIFTRLKSKTHWAGKRVGSLNVKGYRVINVLGKPYYAHRLAWFLMTGAWANMIDHRDCNKDNNAFANLREATKPQNMANRGKPVTNTTGFKGIRKHRRKWVAQITVDGQFHYLGIFTSPEAANAAYGEAAKRHYGEFGRHV